MKTLIVTAALAATIYSSNGQDYPKPFEFKLVDSTQTGKDQLYQRAHAWMAKTYVSAQDVIQLDDKAAGKLIGKGVIPVPVKNGFGIVSATDYVHYTITIDVRDGKYRCVLSDFYHTGGIYKNSTDAGSLELEKPACGTFFFTKRRWHDDKDLAVTRSKELLQSLKDYVMKDQGTADKDGF